MSLRALGRLLKYGQGIEHFFMFFFFFIINLCYNVDDESTVDIVDAVVLVVGVVVAVDNIEAVADGVAVAAVDYSVLNLNHVKLVLLAKDVVAKYWAVTVIEHWPNDVVMNRLWDILIAL